MISEIKSYLKEKKIDSALFFGLGKKDPNLFYLTGYEGIGVLVVRKTGAPFMVVPIPEYHIAKSMVRNIKVINSGKNRVLEVVKKKISKGTIAFDFAGLRYDTYIYAKQTLGAKNIANLSQRISEMRSIKTNKELSKIKKACILAEEIVNEGIRTIKNHKTEAELSAYLEYLCSKKGHRTAFETIVASAKNTGKWHHRPTNKIISKGFLLIDFGVEYMGYCSDITRTYYVGKPLKKEVETYDLILRIKEKCISMIKPGSSISEVHNYAKKKIGPSFVHALGHGIGVEVHEGPAINPGSKTKFSEGMVLAIEPGTYFPNKFGVRLEDDVVVGKKGAVNLTSCEKELKRIKI